VLWVSIPTMVDAIVAGSFAGDFIRRTWSADAATDAMYSLEGRTSSAGGARCYSQSLAHWWTVEGAD
jgi:hypothetical protein